jgi:hypothetical protein
MYWFIGIALGIGELLTRLTPLPNLSMIFLMAVLFTAFVPPAASRRKGTVRTMHHCSSR